MEEKFLHTNHLSCFIDILRHFINYRKSYRYSKINFHVNALKDLLFMSNQVTQSFSCWVFLLSLINLALKVNLFFSVLRGKYCSIHLEIVKKIITLKYYLKQDNVAPPPSPPHNIILFELDFEVKFPLLRILQFLSDLKKL